jgi:SAM-dependent methyltransferase
MTPGENRTTTAHHWDRVYRTKAVDEVSWYQAAPATSTRRLLGVAPCPSSVIDVGAGASLLADALLDAGLTDLTLLDVSEASLAVVRDRLADRRQHVTFVVADVLTWEPQRQWDAWHDRALFHFLVDSQARAKYVATATRAIAPSGVAVVGCFALDGPQQCSGLPTARYDADGIAAQFGDAFRLERVEREVHRTPGGADQPFTWVVLRSV